MRHQRRRRWPKILRLHCNRNRNRKRVGQARVCMRGGGCEGERTQKTQVEGVPIIKTKNNHEVEKGVTVSRVTTCHQNCCKLVKLFTLKIYTWVPTYKHLFIEDVLSHCQSSRSLSTHRSLRTRHWFPNECFSLQNVLSIQPWYMDPPSHLHNTTQHHKQRNVSTPLLH